MKAEALSPWSGGNDWKSCLHDGTIEFGGEALYGWNNKRSGLNKKIEALTVAVERY